MGVFDFTASEGKDVVSFDVFDTLLVRPYAKPKDLFHHISDIICDNTFYEKRIQAERNGRTRREDNEVSFDEIYSELSEYYSCKTIECDLELNCVPYIPVVDFYNKCLESGKRIVIVSDMYLPSTFIEKLLLSVGIEGYEKIYVSHECGASKGNGKLFDIILKDLNINPEKIVHIGDNPISDYSTPMKKNITSILIPKLIDIYYKHHKSSKRYCGRNSWERSTIVSLDAIAWMMNGFEDKGGWKSISFRYGGPAVYGYCNFIENHSIGDNLFIARDGYNLIRASKLLYGTDGHYIYAPRIANILAGDRYKEYQNYKIIIINKLFPECWNMNNKEKETFFDNNLEEVERRRSLVKNGLKKRIENCVSKDSVSVIDVTTLKYTSQALISELLPNKKIKGIYCHLLNVDNKYNSDGYYIRKNVIQFSKNVNIMEFFMTSPEPPIDNIDYNGIPLFRKVDDNEKTRLDIYHYVTNGELDYCGFIKHVFKKHLPTFSYETVSKWLCVLAYKSDTKTRKMLTDIKWPVDSSHKRYVSMVFHPRDSGYHLKKNVTDILWYMKSLSTKNK